MTKGTISWLLVRVDKQGRETWMGQRRGLSIKLAVQDSGSWSIAVRPVDQPGPRRLLPTPEELSLVDAMRFCEEHTNEELLDLEGEG